jgi:hypothetical protein
LFIIYNIFRHSILFRLDSRAISRPVHCFYMIYIMQYTTMMILFFAIVLFLALIVVNFVQLRQFSENDIEGNMNCVNGKKAYKHWYKNGYSKRKSREYPNLTCRPSSV